MLDQEVGTIPAFCLARSTMVLTASQRCRRPALVDDVCILRSVCRVVCHVVNVALQNCQSLRTCKHIRKMYLYIYIRLHYIYIYIFMYIYIYTSVCIYICVYMYIYNIYIYIYVCIYIYAYMYICIYVYMFICICICIYTRISICIYIYMHVYLCALGHRTRAQFSMWAVLAAPLLISGSILNMSADTLATYSNKEVAVALAEPVFAISI